MNIQPVNSFPKETVWETKTTDILPPGIEKIGLTYEGDVYLKNGKTIWRSRNHLTDLTPAVVSQTFKGNKNHVDGHIGQALGGIGETQVRDVLLKTAKVNPYDLLYPLLVKTLQGHKELSDGILIHGNHAFILQVKTSIPTNVEDNVEWYRQKIRNNRSLAVKQAVTSHELLKEHKRLEFDTYSGEKRVINVQDCTWSYLNVLAFSQLPAVKPARFVLPASNHHLPSTTISLKEWKDLFSYLPYGQAVHLLKRLCYLEEPEFFGFNIFNIFQGCGLNIYSRRKETFAEKLENLLKQQPINRRFLSLRKKLDTLPVEQLTMLSQAYEKYQNKASVKTLGLNPYLKVKFSSSTPGIEYKNRGVILHF